MHAARLSSTLAFAGLLFFAGTASASEMDLALHRLRIRAVDPAEDPNAVCSTVGPHGARLYCPDHGAFRRLMTQLGIAMAPPLTTPAATVGFAGFRLAFETWITGISDQASYWQLGTRGDAASRVEGRNRFVHPTMTFSRLALRKGLPFGFELGASAGHAYRSSLYTWGAEVKWALLEGLRDKPALPDVALRAMVQTMTGDRSFRLTVPAADLTLSKPIVIGSTVSFTPFVSGQYVLLFADSKQVDLTPEVNALEACRPELPGAMSPNPGGGTAGGLVCTGDSSDFNHNVSFRKVRSPRYRGALGFELRYEAFALSGSFAMDVVRPSTADRDLLADGGTAMPRQWTMSVGAGLVY